MKATDQDAVTDSDLAGPLVFCMAFGATLLLAGKIHFGYVVVALFVFKLISGRYF